MSKPSPYPFYTIWNGSLNMGDTPGVYNVSAFVGLMLQIPVNVTFIPTSKSVIDIMLMTNEVEIFKNKKHAVYFDWIPGTPLPTPIGYIDDVDYIPSMPEYHRLKINTLGLTTGNHSITIIVNNEITAGLSDDFVLYKIDVDNDAGIRVGNF